MNQDEQLETIELSIKQANDAIEKMEALLRLTENKDFKLLVTEGYFEKEASRLVLLRADSNMQDEAGQSLINKSIDGVGFLRQYFSTIMHFGRMAEKAKVDHEDAREGILREVQ